MTTPPGDYLYVLPVLESHVENATLASLIELLLQMLPMGHVRAWEHWDAYLKSMSVDELQQIYKIHDDECMETKMQRVHQYERKLTRDGENYRVCMMSMYWSILITVYVRLEILETYVIYADDQTLMKRLSRPTCWSRMRGELRDPRREVHYLQCLFGRFLVDFMESIVYVLPYFQLRFQGQSTTLKHLQDVVLRVTEWKRVAQAIACVMSKETATLAQTLPKRYRRRVEDAYRRVRHKAILAERSYDSYVRELQEKEPPSHVYIDI